MGMKLVLILLQKFLLHKHFLQADWKLVEPTILWWMDVLALHVKITIDVVGVCGNGEISDWENGIFGAQNACIGETETYTAEDVTKGLDGAEEYYYYLNGVLIDEGEEQYTIDITWDTPGSYELCVDVSNLPCISRI